jgi:hypothetical protein
LHTVVVAEDTATELEITATQDQWVRVQAILTVEAQVEAAEQVEIGNMAQQVVAAEQVEQVKML